MLRLNFSLRKRLGIWEVPKYSSSNCSTGLLFQAQCLKKILHFCFITLDAINFNQCTEVTVFLALPPADSDFLPGRWARWIWQEFAQGLLFPSLSRCHLGRFLRMLSDPPCRHLEEVIEENRERG